MSVETHGLSIGIERIDNHFYMTLKAKGKLTHEDYQTITPMIDGALQGVKDPEIKALMDVTELDGWELQAAWDDFKLVLKHGNEFQKIALVGNKGWQEWAARIGSWFIGGEAQYFETMEEALAWLRD